MKEVIVLSVVNLILSFFTNSEVLATPPQGASTYVTPKWNDPSIVPQKFCISKCSGTIPLGGTVQPEADADAIQKSIKGFGDPKYYIRFLTFRTLDQRLQIAEAYKTKFSVELETDAGGKTKGGFQDAIVAMLTPLPVFYAKELRKSIDGAGADQKMLAEILGTISNFGINSTASFYKQLHSKSLEDDIKAGTSGNFQKLMLSLLQAKRDESRNVDSPKAVADAQALHKAGTKSWPTGPVLNEMLVTRSYTQLRQVFLEYEKIAGHDIEDDIKKEFPGNAGVGYLALIQCIKSPPKFLAGQLCDGLKAPTIKDRDIIRVIVGRSEIDLMEIKNCFRSICEKPLGSVIKEKTKDDYATLLLKTSME